MISGEASGDLQGAHLAAQIRRLLPEARIWGVGGRRMTEAGVEVRYDSSTWSAIGACEAVKVGPRLLRVLLRLGAELRADPPHLLILIDFGFFNVRLARRVRPRNAKVLYYFPPGSWNRNAGYGRLNGIADAVVTPFPWSAERLREEGFHAEFFGHPLLDVVKPSLSREEFCTRLSLDPDRRIVGLLPGSRAQEIRHNVPALLLVAARLRESFPSVQFVVPLAPSTSASVLAREIARVPWVDVRTPVAAGYCAALTGERTSFPAIGATARKLLALEGIAEPDQPVVVHLVSDMTHDVLAHARAAAVTSGTATVEAAILDCPMVIFYRGSKLAQLEYNLRGKNIRFIGMPNIIADRLVCPELVLGEATPSRISKLMEGVIADSPHRAQMLADLAEVRAMLGPPGAVEKTARLALEMIRDAGRLSDPQ